MQSDGSTLVLEGSLPQGIEDTYTLALTKAPEQGNVVRVSLAFDAQLNVNSSDARYDVITRTVTFTDTNWNNPITLLVSAVDDTVKENRLSSRIVHTVSSAHGTYAAEPVVLDVRVIDNDTPGVFIAESDGSTRVIRSTSVDPEDPGVAAKALGDAGMTDT